MTRSIVCAATVCFSQSRFTGKERDAESGLDNFGARYMASSMGRFMSPDPSGLLYADMRNPQSLNLYSYVLNNPLIYTDPTGKTCQTNSSDGTVYDDNDGKGCDVVDKADAAYQNNKNINVVTADGSRNLANEVQGETDNAALVQYVKNQAPRYPNLTPPTPDQYIKAIALAAPTVCGAGAFAYGGRSVDAGPANGFAGGIVEADTRDEVSKGALFEGGSGEGVVGGGGLIVSSDGKGLGSSNFIYGGPGVEVPGAHVGAGLVGFTNGAGVYGEVSAGGREVGAGLYVNITNNANCMEKK
ncbi:RHS repeat-associated core domain-containing protein [Granulicella sp. WH15]|uniref:RHS repeat-associated core domain-containing protein n=1 Tax=Granulicella sp. WH15 TaxID=2602070 RepID=UPI0013670720|nr:RHS repeat-associated core domain-containing protein [Granulicella sp. WH15]QHN03181.1 RHS repeat-associated core domain-containing protein [Granulicella sp. WH15]